MTSLRYGFPKALYLHLALGLLIVPLGLGQLDPNDFFVRLPIVLVIVIDAGLAFQIALIYTRDIWPNREFAPEVILGAMFRPWVGWMAALGYYLTALWVIMAIIARPDGPINPTIAFIFISGYVLVGLYKFAKLQLVNAVAEQMRHLRAANNPDG